MAPDARVQAAIDHWGPRFVQAGVDASDFQATTRRIETWDEWLDEWCASGDVHAALAREAQAAGRTLTAGEAWARAAVAYHFAKFVWVLDAERATAASRKAIEALYRAHSLLDPTAERVEAPLDGSYVAANLRRPPDAERPPLVVLIPGLDSTKEEFLQLENVFLARGTATASLDGPGQGETGERLSLRHDYEVAVTALLDELAGRADVDLDRVGAMGVSLGGYYAPRAAAFEPRVKAVAGISGPFNFVQLWEQAPPLSRETFIAKARAGSDEEARRIAERLDLGGVLGGLRQPFLAVTGMLDRLVPWQQTERQAREAPNAEFVLYEDGNHGCANLAYKARPLVADWLREQLA
ncbi:MAG: alpha/beta fold hydrolase [Solirubrobacterales bacterium]|nr:alpha/beta fold hydrolase [Solirubrobacterales bacterium]